MKQTLTGYEVYSLLLNIQNDFQSIGISNIILNNSQTMYESYCVVNKSGDIQYQIGVREIQMDLNKEFDFDEAMVPIVCMFHEVSGHGGQLELEFQKDTSLSKVLALSYFAGKCSESYYDVNYWKHPHEVAAQYMAIKESYAYLSDVWDFQQATVAVLAYEKYRLDVENGAYLKEQKSYSDVESILKDLNEQFLTDVHSMREVNSHMASMQDSYSEYVHKRSNLEQKVLKQKDGLKQDFLLASIYFQMKNVKEDLVIQYPVLRSLTPAMMDPFRLFQQPIRPKPRGDDLDLRKLSRRKTPWVELDHQDFSEKLDKLNTIKSNQL